MSRQTHPLICSAALADALECRGVLPDAPLIAGDEIMFMPAGVHEITPSQAGERVRVQVLCDRQAAVMIERQRAAMAAKGVRPYFDLNHDDQEASFWPTSFEWKDGDAPGIYAKGEWSAAGRACRDGKTYRQFSPVFFVDDTSKKPARVVCNEQAGPNMGGLVNNPAFKKILPLWAKNPAGASSDNPNPTDTNMNEKELAALRAKNQELLDELNKLKGEQTALKAKDENDTLVSARITAHEAEIKANKAILEAEELKAKNADLLKADQTRREADAERAVSEAVERGAIAAKDEETKAHWKKLIVADSANAGLLAKQAGSAAVGGERQTKAVQVEAQDSRDILKAYDELRCKQLTVADTTGKIALSKKMAKIWASDMRSNERFLGSELVAADVTDPNLGTLAGTLVAQRTLELFKLEFGNILKFVSTDFSDVPGLFNQTTTTRVEMIPAVMDYDPTLGTDGRPKGYVVTTPAESKDVPITLNRHKAVEIVFNANVLGSTVRNLFGEQSEGQAYALANAVISQLYALFTSANFNYNPGLTVAASAFGRNTFSAAGVILNPNGMPHTNRFALLNSAYYGALTTDSNLVNFAAFQRPEIVTQAELMPISKFQPLEAPNLPTTGNLAGVFGHKAATVIQARVPSDYSSVLPGASFGNVAVVTDPELGLSTLVTQYVSHQGGYAAQRQALMFGVAPGIAKAALLLLSSGSLTGTGAGTPDFAS